MSKEINIAVRPETEGDLLAIHELNVAAFGREAEALLVDALRRGDAFVPGLSLVAVVEGRMVGHILFTRIQIQLDGGGAYPSLSLAPMAVLPVFQNRGIGSALVRAGLVRAAELGEEAVIVLGHPEYYPRFGFLPASKWGIRSPYNVPDPVFMGIELVNGALAGNAGLVVYPKEFADL
ncbi:MAG: N-acetyltransferase [Bacteroidia bacterium]